MDWLTFIATDMRTLAWPTVGIVAMVLFKNDISALLRILGSRLQKLKILGGEATFGQGVDDVENKLSPADTRAITESEDVKRIDEVSELARLPPPYIVSQAWLRLEQAIRETVDERSFANVASYANAQPSRRAYLNINALKGILSESEIGVVHELRQLRNRAAHSLEPDITITDALRYNDIADSLIQKIKQHRREQSSSSEDPL